MPFPEYPERVPWEWITCQDLAEVRRINGGIDYQVLIAPRFPQWSQNKRLQRACAGEETQ